MAMEDNGTEIEEEYMSSLLDLNVNSKPLINMLTMLAEENLSHAEVIVRAVEKHLLKVAPESKLPILYLIDSIVKNVSNKYKQLFAQNIVNIFCGVFEKVPEKVREKMFNLRMTWNEVFPQTKLYALDVKINLMDPNWPITAKIVPKSVHVNPNFLMTNTKPPETHVQSGAQKALLAQMEAKEQELLELKKRKIELELMVTKKKIAESEKEIRGLPQAVPMLPHHGVGMPSGVGVNHAMLLSQHPHGSRTRIAPVNQALIVSARLRDPRLSRMRPNATSTMATAADQQHPPTHKPTPFVAIPNVSAKSLPRIPKFSQSSSSKPSTRDRDPRSRKDETKSPSKSPSSKDKSKSSSSKSSSSSSRSSDRKKSGSSDDSSPRKKSEEEKKSSRSSHRQSSRSSSSSAKSPSKTVNENKDVDLRVIPVAIDMTPDSTTNNGKDKLLSDLLNGEEMKSCHENTSEDNGKEQKPILVFTMNVFRFVVT